MNITQFKEKPRIGNKQPQVPVEHDGDWEYTGEFFICPECGHDFKEPPYNIDVCPECGADFWEGEE